MFWDYISDALHPSLFICKQTLKWSYYQLADGVFISLTHFMWCPRQNILSMLANNIIDRVDILTKTESAATGIWVLKICNQWENFYNPVNLLTSSCKFCCTLTAKSLVLTISNQTEINSENSRSYKRTMRVKRSKSHQYETNIIYFQPKISRENGR